MSRARLRALRLVGFKSFAEKTVIEFGPGISAVIGPNGSGKSNLADALRWSLGEQGRTLRTRRAEDLIFAGSSTRRAQGMADVTLVIDNEDRLLPVDFGEIELGRRLFRSGENEYLLNRQRIRLRDLVDLLDEANLADNAFLFIGQGMVDQALALRPEERRPLFEEAAGTRKHERRRRAATNELNEAEANLERVRDLLGELRPQAKRLAAQAEQQAQRRDAGRELADALVALARSRLGGAERESALQAAAGERATREAEEALGALRTAEETVAAITRGLAERAVAERDARATLDVARDRVVEARLRASRIASDVEALRRDRDRVAGEGAALRERLDAAARDLALPAVEPDDAAEDALRDVEGRLSDAVRTLAEAREAGRGDEGRARRLRQVRDAHLREVAQSRQRAQDAARRLTEAEAEGAASGSRASVAERDRAAAAAAAALATAGETDAELAAEEARGHAVTAEARAADATAQATAALAALAAAEARAAALDQLLAVARPEAATARIRAAGGRPVSAGLEVEPALRRAVEAVMGDVLGAHLVPGGAIPALTDVGGALVIAEPPAPRPGRDRETQLGQARAASIVERASVAGGGALSAAIRRDPSGLVERLLGHSVWVPQLTVAIELARSGLLGPGWRVATPAGELVDDVGVVRLPAAASLLERRAERSELDGVIAAARDALTAATRSGDAATAELLAARQARDGARLALDAARRARRVADEAERGAARRAEATGREAAWAEAQLERARAAVTTARAEHEATAEEARRWEVAQEPGAAPPDDVARAEVRALEAGVAALARERDRRLDIARDARERLEADRERRRRAELRGAMDGARADELDRDMARLAGAEADLAAGHEAVTAELGATGADEARAADALRALEASGTDDRVRLAAVERTVSEARERLRAAEGRARAADVRRMEVRVQLDAAREGLLVELAAIGTEGLAALRVESATQPEPPPAPEPPPPAPEPPPPPGRPTVDDVDAEADESGDLTAALEAALDAAIETWRASPPANASPASSPGRLPGLRRRYHELGSGNPYAADELAVLSGRLDTLEAQRTDLESAIRSTRELIARLEALITQQFRTTFAALEGAFARRFQQLFDGGEAELSLTQPEDLGTTGVEITARPPGKKRQPLAMLSGGERALTAVALLLAMLEVRPVPFCVLDEVDAALDEANVGRFSAALRGLAETIQFVVITHNRGTIEAADALYGVTVGDDAVSRIVSLRLGDVETVGEQTSVPMSA